MTRLLEPFLPIIISVIVSVKSNRSPRPCEGSINLQVNTNGTCKYIFYGLNFADTYSEAIQQCAKNNSVVGPIELKTIDFTHLVGIAADCGRMHTSYTYDTNLGVVLLDGSEVNSGGYVWENSSRPSADFPLIIAGYSNNKLVFSPGRPEEQHLFICVEDPCFEKSCADGTNCVTIPGICGYQCVAPTTTKASTASTTTSQISPAETTTNAGANPAVGPSESTTIIQNTDPPGGLELWMIVLIAVAVAIIAICCIVYCIQKKRGGTCENHDNDLLKNTSV